MKSINPQTQTQWTPSSINTPTHIHTEALNSAPENQQWRKKRKKLQPCGAGGCTLTHRSTDFSSEPYTPKKKALSLKWRKKKTFNLQFYVQWKHPSKEGKTLFQTDESEKTCQQRTCTQKMLTVHRRKMIPDMNCDLYSGIKTTINGKYENM